MRRWLRLWFLRQRESDLVGSIAHHRAMRDLHASAYVRDSDALSRVRVDIACETPARVAVARLDARMRVVK